MNVLLNNPKQNSVSLSLLVGTTVVGGLEPNLHGYKIGA